MFGNFATSAFRTALADSGCSEPNYFVTCCTGEMRSAPSEPAQDIFLGNSVGGMNLVFDSFSLRRGVSSDSHQPITVCSFARTGEAGLSRWAVAMHTTYFGLATMETPWSARYRLTGAPGLSGCLTSGDTTKMSPSGLPSVYSMTLPT